MMGFVLRCLKAAWSLWLAVQVELQGQYSIQRMRDLVEYTEKTSALRVMSVCLFTPVPCLVLMTLIDCVSLARPEAGTDANYVHWCRNYFTVAFISYAILEQFRHTVVGVHLGTWQMMLITALASAAGVGTQYAMSHVIGFPLPFSLVIGTPAWASSMIVLFLFNSSHKFQQSAAFRASMKNFVIVFMGQISLTLIYPAYIFGLVSVRKSLQSSFVLLLPLIKIATKNWISRFLGDLDDMKPEIVVFNIEIFNALYVACSMQNASSLTTSLVLMTLDLLQAWISHRDVDEVIAEINVLMAKIPVKDHAYSGKNCIEVALLIIDDDVKVRTHSSLRMFSLRPLGVVIGPTAAQMKQHVAWPSPAPSFHIPKPGTIVPSSSIPATPPMLLFASEYPMVVLNNTQSSARSQRRDTVQSPSGAKIFTSAERLRFAQKCTRLLFTTEFIILIEYTEVIIPVIYSLYVFAVLRLKNREFYPQLAHLHGPELERMMSNVFTYAVLELVSLVLMTYLLKKKLRIDTTRQLTFVLQRQWTMVHSKILMWFFYVVQTSLVHFGADFSFKFAWLHDGFQAPSPTPPHL